MRYETKNVTIIGAGPAGIAASIYLKRAGFDPLVIEKDEIGGLLLNANLVENYPGFPEGITGRDLVELFKRHLSILDIGVTRAEVASISRKKDLFRITTSDGDHSSRAIIMATGTAPRRLGVSGEEGKRGIKLYYEVKDIPNHQKENDFMIIGGGDAAFDYALNLAQNSARVDILFRSVEPGCLPLLRERVGRMKNIHLHPKTTLVNLSEEGDRIRSECESKGQRKFFKSDFVLAAVGREPRLDVLPERIRGALNIGENGETNVPGLYIAGDVRRGIFRQAGIAVGDGICSAMSLEEFLREKDLGVTPWKDRGKDRRKDINMI